MARYERAALQAAPPAATRLVLVTLLGARPGESVTFQLTSPTPTPNVDSFLPTWLRNGIENSVVVTEVRNYRPMITEFVGWPNSYTKYVMCTSVTKMISVQRIN